MSTPSEIRSTRRDLRRHRKRIAGLVVRCIATVCDGDVILEHRQRAESNLGVLQGELGWVDERLAELDADA